MKHSLRNSLILLAILIAVGIYFYISIRSINLQIAETETALNIAQRELQSLGGLTPDTLQVSYLFAQKDFLERWNLENSKYFLKSENSKISWEYLHNIIRRFNPDFQFNFADASRGSDTFYNLTGSAPISDLYTFISFIEKLGALYTIETVTLNPILTESDNGPINLVNFSMMVKPHTNPTTGQDILNTPFRRIAYSPLKKDPFRPAVYMPITDPRQERFVHYQDLRLASFSGNQAFFLDKSGNLIIMHPNHPVAYGYYSHIDENNRAVFKINRTGLYETFYSE